MPKSRIIIVLGVLIALLPVLGFPRAWEAFFQIMAGLSIVLLSVWTAIDRKLSLKAKAQMRQTRRVDMVAPESTPAPETPVAFAKRVTDFYPKTGQQGRRLADLKGSSSNQDQQ